MANGTGSGIVAPLGTISTVYTTPYSASQIQQAASAQLALTQALNPCGPIAQPGLPGSSSPPLWIVPPGDTFTTTVEGDISTVTGEPTAQDGISLNELYNIQIPWWIFVVIVLLILLATDRRK